MRWHRGRSDRWPADPVVTLILVETYSLPQVKRASEPNHRRSREIIGLTDDLAVQTINTMFIGPTCSCRGGISISGRALIASYRRATDTSARKLHEAEPRTNSCSCGQAFQTSVREVVALIVDSADRLAPRELGDGSRIGLLTSACRV